MREKICKWFYNHGWLWIAAHISKEAILWDAQRCTDAFREGYIEGFKEGRKETFNSQYNILKGELYGKEIRSE